MQENNITTSLNPQYDADGNWDGIEELSQYLDLFIANEEETIHIGRAPTLLESAETILSWGCKAVIVTCGAKGSVAFSRNKDGGVASSECLGFIVDEVKDSTGAGDAFVGGFLVSWLKCKSIVDAMEAACLCGASAVRQFGGSTSELASLVDVSLLNKHRS